jgi:hypothetical protein
MASSFAREKFVWLNQVRADPDLTPLAFMLAYVLSDFVNEREGCAWPGIAHLAAECHVTEKGVKKVIRSLVERGHLSVEVGVGRGRTNRYRWNIKLDNACCIGGASHAHDDRGVLPSSRRDAPQVPYPAKKGQLGFPLSTPKRGTVVPKKGNWRSRKGEPQFPQPNLKNLFMILLKDPRHGNTHKSRPSASATFGASIRRRLIEARLSKPLRRPARTRRLRTSFLAPCATQVSAPGRTPASQNIQRPG